MLSKNITAVLSIMLMICLPYIAHAQNRALSADEIKSAYLYNFGKFVRWENTLNELPTINYCIVNAPTIGHYLDGLGERKLQNKPIKIYLMKNLAESKHCHVIFVGERNAERIFKTWKNQHSLLIGDSSVITENGGIVELVVIDERVVFNVNLARAHQAGLIINANLLELAATVTNDD